MVKQIHLADFIAERRRSLGRISRDEVASRAKRAGHDLSGSYIAKIENRETEPSSISAAKIEALAAGLGLSADELFRVARGEPAPNTLMPEEAARFWESFQKLDPEDQEEIQGMIERRLRRIQREQGKQAR